MIASLVNTPPDGTAVIDDLATLTGTPPLFVLQFLRDLEAKGLLKVVLTLGGYRNLSTSMRHRAAGFTGGTVIFTV
jgi:DNA-binding IscR family transcriptional regulator